MQCAFLVKKSKYEVAGKNRPEDTLQGRDRGMKMIREYCDGDKKQLENILRQGIVMTCGNNVDYITRDASRIILYEDHESGVIGFCSFEIWGKDKKKGEINTYIIPKFRRKGIGTLLYNEIISHVNVNELDYISTVFRVDKDDPTSFYKKLGYKKWYGLHNLQYNELEQPVSDLKFVLYEDKYFEQYAEGMRTSFYEMRKTNDFEPYLCCELSQEKREEFLNNKDHIYLLMENEKLIAAISVLENGFIDNVFVVPAYQGKGYGKLSMQFAINKALKLNNSISLNVVEENTKACNLYYGLGFDTVQTKHYYRLASRGNDYLSNWSIPVIKNNGL
jgi:ribosomal protein S18 acetylase RimI-like enzyme